jgi:hypothetical protein
MNRLTKMVAVMNKNVCVQAEFCVSNFEEVMVMKLSVYALFRGPS